MVVAGNETTTKLLANAMYWGARNPDQLARVRRPLPCPTVGRGDPAVRHVEPDPGPRRRSDIEFHGTIPDAGDTLLLVPGSAHRDERVFDDPDEFRIGRDIGSRLLSFGSGAHFCLGAHLARMEARVALTELNHPRVRGYEVDEANAVRVHSSNVRGLRPSAHHRDEAR
jgi:cytochrome P450